MSIYAWADLHGRMDILQTGLKCLKPEDKIYFLGDAADRGPDGWECIKTILNDKRFVYLKGNHEDLMVNAIGNFKSSTADWYWSHEIEVWYWNGGRITHLKFSNDPISDVEKRYYLNQLKTLPFCAIYYNIKGQEILLSHAGCDSFEVANYWDEEKFLWDRNHLMFYDAWDGKEDDGIIVHGHTPIELMVKDQVKNAKQFHDVEPLPWDGKSAYWYGQEHKVNIDTGAVWNNTSLLLNLDTWEQIILTV